MANDAVLYESRDHIATITINRPDKMNALNQDVADGLLASFQRLNASDDRVAILTGAGDTAFSAGADLKTPPQLWTFMPGVGIEVEKPLIAAVNGWCIGGAIVLVQFCDLCVMAEGARFNYPEAKIGFSGGLIAGVVARMPHKIAMELMLVGEDMTAQRAYDVGFVNKVVPRDELMSAATDYARKLAGNAPLVLSMLKRFSNGMIPQGPSEQGGIARRSVEATFASEDLQEGLAAYREKRAPNFTGR